MLLLLKRLKLYIIILKWREWGSDKKQSEMEDEIEEAKHSGLYQLPNRNRGNHSSNFRKIKVVSNHYHLDTKKMEKIVIFSVKFTPFIPDDNSKLRRQLLEKVKPKITQNISNPVFSGKNIYTLTDPKAKEMEYQQDSYTISIKQVKIYDLTANPKLFLAFMNNALRNSMRNINYVQIGKTGKYFNSMDKTPIDNLVMYNGFKSNFVELERGIYLRVDAAKKIVRNQTVLEFIDHIININKDKEKDERRMILKEKLINQTVMSNYGRTVYHRITDLKFEDMSTINITTPEETMNLLEFYKKKYNITINKPKQPLVVAEGRRKEETILLVPELLLMTGIPEDFDEFRRKKVSEITIKPPHDKKREIGELMNKLKDCREINDLEGIGIKLNREMERINAKHMQAPTLELGKKQSVDKGKQAFFNLFNKPIFSAKHSIELGIIHFKGTNFTPLIDTFINTSRNLGVDFKYKAYEINASGRPSAASIEKEMLKCCDDNQNICLIIIPSNMKTQYKNIKINAIDNNQMLTQVMCDLLFRKNGFQSIATKILLQILAKRGNTLWVPRPICNIENTMIVGYDNAANKLAICATINSTFSSVFSAVKPYGMNSDRYGKMADLLVEACNAYMSRNKTCPKEIIVYMNTCAGDQVKLYHEFFIEPAKNRMEEIYKGSRIKLTVVMVNVKTSERFFLEDGNSVRNVNAGTLVSQDLVSMHYDFYIMSQQSNKGTTVPNHYKVIYTSSNLDEGELQELSFSQCFNYVNWTGSIKVPAILQYAKKCVKFVSEVMENKQVPEALTTKLYFV